MLIKWIYILMTTRSGAAAAQLIEIQAGPSERELLLLLLLLLPVAAAVVAAAATQVTQLQAQSLPLWSCLCLSGSQLQIC